VRRRLPLLAGAATLAVLLTGCGGSDEPASAATATPSSAPTSTNTVAGCQAAAIREILAGNLGQPDDGSGDYPECVGLSQAQLNTAAQGTIADPAVRNAMSAMVDRDLDALETDPPAAPTLPPDPSESPAPTP
jgi:hypothetical protein